MKLIKESNVDILIDKLKKTVAPFLKKDDDGHNLDHIKRVVDTAIYLQSIEGGDLEVIVISCFLHDLHRWKSLELNKEVKPSETLPLIAEILKDYDLNIYQKELILEAIKNHEIYRFNEPDDHLSIEAKILEDADRLDAIGEVGLTRTILYSMNHNIPIYDPSIPLVQNDIYDETIKDPSMVHHIVNKLLRLKDIMHTNTAKILAEEKSKVLEEFVAKYLKENAK